MKKVWLDTDIGSDIDAALALPYLLKHPDIELLGITTVTDDTQKRAAYADLICRYLGRQIPIYAGATLGLDIGSIGNRINMPHEKMAEMYPHADTFGHGTHEAILRLRDAIMAHPHEITLICIGALTNAALLFTLYPEVVEQLAGLAIMGGAYGENPRCTWDIRVEWNCKCDPYAAKIVLESGVQNIMLAGVELTWDVQLPTPEAYRLIADIPCMQPQAEGIIRHWKSAEIWFHDVLLCAAFARPEIGIWERGNVTVEIQKDGLLGQTIFTPDANGKYAVMRGIVGGNEAFYREYTKILNM